jgi:hypothetical protein
MLVPGAAGGGQPYGDAIGGLSPSLHPLIFKYPHLSQRAPPPHTHTHTYTLLLFLPPSFLLPTPTQDPDPPNTRLTPPTSTSPPPPRPPPPTGPRDDLTTWATGKLNDRLGRRPPTRSCRPTPPCRMDGLYTAVRRRGDAGRRAHCWCC